MGDAGHHDENVRMLERLLETRDDADLHLLLARTLLAMERHEDSLAAVRRAIRCAPSDAAVLTKAASMCFYAGDLETARGCIDRAKTIAPRDFALKSDLKELDRHAVRRERGRADEKRLLEAFDADPGRPGLAAEFARHLIRNGQRYAAYHVVARALRHRADDRALRRLEKKLRAAVPDDVRAEAEQWAASERPFRVR